jgi:site-specific DNA-cytosine methylase
MNVLSLFDGMSCGQIALTELGCFPDKYYASEVDKFAHLQTVPDWYKWVVSDTQIYRMCGNGWTVKVIEHILSHLFKN